MKLVVTVFVFCFIAICANGQLPNKVKKITGTWKYKSGDGFEVWNLEDDILFGTAFRVNKVGDTTKVEDLKIRKINKTLVYTVNSKHFINDSLVVDAHNFVGTKKKMEFVNIESNIPVMISYSFGFLNRNKLKILIQYGIKDEPVVLILNRIKE